MKPKSDSEFWRKKRKVKKKFSQTSNPFHIFTVLVSFCLVPRLTLISQLFSFLIFIIIFTINDTFYGILLLNDIRDIANFTIYILQIGMSPFTKKIITNIYSLYFLNNTNHIFTTTVCKLFVIDFVITTNWLFLFIYFNDTKYIYFLTIVNLFCYYYRLIFFRLISL